MARIGVLALQGDFEAHARVLSGLGADVALVRRVAALSELDGLVIPGGESTTLLNLMADEPWFAALKSFHGDGRALMGTCAGAILLAREVVHPPQPSLGLLDAVIERNAYGPQVESFETQVESRTLGGPIDAVFIRAPRFTELGPKVETLATHDGAPVCVQDGRVLAMTFHPELTGKPTLHEYFLSLARPAALTGRLS